MKKVLFMMLILFPVLFLILLIISCRQQKKPIQGFFYIRSEKPVDIIYTNILGIDEVITTDELDVPFEVGTDIKRFEYRIFVSSSSGVQTIMIKVFFDDNNSDNDFERVYYYEEEVTREAIYYPPWVKELDEEIKI